MISFDDEEHINFSLYHFEEQIHLKTLNICKYLSLSICTAYNHEMLIIKKINITYSLLLIVS